MITLHGTANAANMNVCLLFFRSFGEVAVLNVHTLRITVCREIWQVAPRNAAFFLFGKEFLVSLASLSVTIVNVNWQNKDNKTKHCRCHAPHSRPADHQHFHCYAGSITTSIVLVLSVFHWLTNTFSQC